VSRRRQTMVSIADAKAHLPELVRRAGAGEEIVVARGGRPVARLVPLARGSARVPGGARGRVRLAPDFGETPGDFDGYLR